MPGPAPKCDDGNVCTGDGCSPDIGCYHTWNDGAACSDNNACTNGDVCKTGICVPGPPLVCQTGGGCIGTACSAQSGCVYTIDSGCWCWSGGDCSVPGAQTSCCVGWTGPRCQWGGC